MEQQLTPIDIARVREREANDLLQHDGWQVNPDDITFINPALHGRWRTSPPCKPGEYWSRQKDRSETMEIVEITVEQGNSHHLRLKQRRATGLTDLREDDSVQWWTEPIRNLLP